MDPTTDAASLYSGFSPHQQTSQVFRLAGRGKVNLVFRTRSLTDKVHTENLFEGALNANKMKDVLWNVLAVAIKKYGEIVCVCVGVWVCGCVCGGKGGGLLC